MCLPHHQKFLTKTHNKDDCSCVTIRFIENSPFNMFLYDALKEDEKLQNIVLMKSPSLLFETFHSFVCTICSII